MQEAVAPNLQQQTGRQGIDHRYANAMQAAGHLVGVVIEFAARMQHRHDHFRCASLLLGVQIDGNATPVIGDADGAIGVDGDVDCRAESRQGLVDGVIDDLEHHVMQSGAVIGVTDVHSRSFAYCLKALQDLDIAGIVIAHRPPRRQCPSIPPGASVSLVVNRVTR